MPTIEQLLTEAINQRNNLADNLTAKGVTSSHDETYNQLVKKVLDIPSSSKEGISVLSTDPQDYLGWGPADIMKEAYIPEGIPQLNGPFQYCAKMTKLYLPASLKSIGSYAFQSCTALEVVMVGKGFEADLTINSSLLTVDSMVSMFENLADLTGLSSKTLTIGTENLSKLSSDQLSIALNKNWNVV